MFKDPQEKVSSNRSRREEKILKLTETIRDPENKLFLITNLFTLEKRGSYICAFTIEDEIEGDYERAIVCGDFYTERDRIGLFCAERDCKENRNNSNMDSAIPVIRLAGESVFECTVIDLNDFPSEEKKSMETNYEMCKIALQNQD